MLTCLNFSDGSSLKRLRRYSQLSCGKPQSLGGCDHLPMLKFVMTLCLFATFEFHFSLSGDIESMVSIRAAIPGGLCRVEAVWSFPSVVSVLWRAWATHWSSRVVPGRCNFFFLKACWQGDFCCPNLSWIILPCRVFLYLSDKEIPVCEPRWSLRWSPICCGHWRALEWMLATGWEGEVSSFSRTPLVSLKSRGLDCNCLE